MEQKWTAEPWRANSYRSGNDIAWEVRSDSGAITGWGQVTQIEANAKRIASCVNAMQGIADPSAVVELVDACFNLFRPNKELEAKSEILSLLNRLKGTA